MELISIVRITTIIVSGALLGVFWYAWRNQYDI